MAIMQTPAISLWAQCEFKLLRPVLRHNSRSSAFMKHTYIHILIIYSFVHVSMKAHQFFYYDFGAFKV